MTSTPELDTAVPTSDSWQTELGGIALTFGAGRLAELGREARALDAQHVLLVADGGLRQDGHIDRAEASLRAADLEVTLFDDVFPNPTTELAQRATEVARDAGVDLIVGMGGGSAMDCSKAVNFLLTNGGRMEDYWGYDKARTPMLPSIGLPTTAGTGSEAQSYTLITQLESGRKMACGAPGAAFRTVILDPELTLSAPLGAFAAAGIDAVSHALESFVTRTRSEHSSALAAEAWRLLNDSFEAGLATDGDREKTVRTRGRMLVGAHLAGAAIEASMLGAAHASANPLTARFGIIHGVAVGLMLPHVIRFNGEAVDAEYRTLTPGGAVELAARTETLRSIAGLPATIRECDIPKTSLPELARLATDEWTGGHNPRPLTEHDFLQLYEAAY